MGASTTSTNVPATLTAPATFYRPELDALRFFAFLAVFATHTIGDYGPELFHKHQFPMWVGQAVVSLAKGGAYGVDLFFVLSAYLITELLLREKEQRGALDVRDFYVRRLLRIWPLYYSFILLAYAVPFLNPGHEFSVRYLVPFLLLSGNWSLTLFGWNAGQVVTPLWSVSVEEQFYLLWAPLVARLSRRQVAIAAMGMVLIANGVRIWQISEHVAPQHLWGNTFAHLDSIAGGVLLSVFMRGRSPNIKAIYRIAMVVFGVSCFAIVSHFVGPDLTTPITTLAVLPGYLAIVLGCIAILVAFLGLRVQFRWLIYLGKISYGLYVYHMACIFVVHKVPTLDHAVLLEFTSLGLTIAVAATSYTFLEKRFLILKRRFTHIRSRPV